jgi:hypothetical protein
MKTIAPLLRFPRRVSMRLWLAACLIIIGMCWLSAATPTLLERKAPDSLRCGAIALHQIAVALQGTRAKTAEIDAAPVPQEGFSLAALVELGQRVGLDLTAVVRPSNEPIIVPCIAHLKAGHYIAIVAQKGKRYWVVDRASGAGRWLDEATLVGESSGHFLVPADQAPATWKRLSQTEAGRITGGIVLIFDGDANDGCGNGSGGSSQAGGGPSVSPRAEAVGCGSCGGGSGGGGNSSGGGTGGDGSSCPTCSGMAKWEVSEPFINSWIYDEPLGYNPGLGFRVSFKLAYKQREARAGTNTDAFSCGPGWDFSWMSYVLPGSGSQATMIVSGGGERSYT